MGQQRQIYQNPRPRRRIRKPVRRMLVLFGVVALVVGAAWFITVGAYGKAGAGPAASAVSAIAMEPAATLPQSEPPLAMENTLLAEGRLVPEGPATGWMPVVDNSAWDTLTLVQPAEPRPAPVEPDFQMLALPANGRVDLAYFDTTVFVGDSLTQGMYIYTQGLPNAKYCAYKGISPKQIYDGSVHTNPYTGESEVPIDAVVAHQPDNVYILLGTNAMVAMENDILLAYYDELINAFKARLDPTVGIYIQSITPVLQGVDRRFTYEDILYLNNNLARMAFEKGVYFVNLHEALAGDDGWMRPEFGARDGYHLQPQGYTAWVDYLSTHTVYKARHAWAYLEQGDVYSQIPKPEDMPPEGETPA